MKKHLLLGLLVLLLVALPIQTEAALTDGLLSCYSLDVDTRDDEANYPGGRVIGATHITAGMKVGTGAYSFDGVNDYVELGNFTDGIDTTDEYSIAFWMKKDTIAAVNRRVFSSCDQFTHKGSACFAVSNGADTNYYHITNHDGTETVHAPGISPFSAGVWYQVVMIYDGTKQQVWIDGVSSANNTVAMTDIEPLSPTCNNIIGAYLQDQTGTCTLSQWYDGDVDEVVVWDRPLSHAEILSVYNSGSGLTCAAISPPVPPSTNIIVYAHDTYNNNTIVGANITVYNGTHTTSNLTNSNGYAILQSPGNNQLNITETRYFNYVHPTNVTNGTTYRPQIYGAFVYLEAYDVNNSQVNIFNVTSGTQSNTTLTGAMRLLLAPNATNSLTVNGQGYQTLALQINTTNRDTGNYNLTGLYETLLNVSAINVSDGATVNSFTVIYTGAMDGNASTTNGQINIPALAGTYDLTLQAVNFAHMNKTETISGTVYDVIFNLYSTNSINISFYDEETLALIDYVKVDIDFISTPQSFNDSTTTGLLYVDLLTPATYILRYDAPGYDQRFYQFVLANNTFNAINLSLLNSTSSSQVTITIKDTLDDNIEGAIIKVKKFNIATNTYDLIEVLTTNFEGQALSNVVLNDEFYTFVIEVDNEIKLITEETQIYGTTLTLIIDLTSGGGFETINRYYGYAGDVSYINSTQTLRFIYNDVSNTASQGCLYLYTVDDTRTQINSSCSNSASGTVNIPVPGNNGTTYQGLGTIIESSGTEINLDRLTITFGDYLPENGAGLLMMFLMIILFFFAMAVNLEIAVITASLIPLVFSAMNIGRLGYGVSIPILAVGVTIALIIGVVKK